mmetsp:Transcript_14022/g.48358  ORF Transcript_14022/g.48358 Transcript_14022/m.48358 type:complete len:177 (+) Transcript_14022:1029-1559(+)
MELNQLSASNRIRLGSLMELLDMCFQEPFIRSFANLCAGSDLFVVTDPGESSMPGMVRDSLPLVLREMSPAECIRFNLGALSADLLRSTLSMLSTEFLRLSLMILSAELIRLILDSWSAERTRDSLGDRGDSMVSHTSARVQSHTLCCEWRCSCTRRSAERSNRKEILYPHCLAFS